MVLVKNWQFFHVFNLGKIDHKNVFHDAEKRKNAFLDHKNVFHDAEKRKNAFLGYKNKTFKIGNISIFLFEGKYSIKMCLRIV